MDDSVKKILNNMLFIAVLARMLGGEAAARLAEAAGAYRDILNGMDIKVDLTGFDGCEQGQKLVKWKWRGEEPNVKLMQEWTDVIVNAIEEITCGKLPRV